MAHDLISAPGPRVVNRLLPPETLRRKLALLVLVLGLLAVGLWGSTP